MPKYYALEPHVSGTTLFAIGDTREVDDENDVKHLVDLGVLSKTKPKADEPKGAPDYERDDLGKLELKKASKDQLLVIAAYEKAEVPEGDRATIPQLIAAIEKHRQPAA